MQNKTLRRLAVATLLAILIGAVGSGVACTSIPDDIGLAEGRLQACPDSPNCVTSENASPASSIAPLAFTGDSARAFDSLIEFLSGEPRVDLLTVEADYVHAVFRTRWLRFRDDVEFRLDRAQHVIHVRSASRLGHSDLGANRERIESLRLRWSPPKQVARPTPSESADSERPPRLQPSSTMTSAPAHEPVIDFSSKDELARWSAADDVVMGGVSSSRLVATTEASALFTGNVSLAQGGGFASVRSTAAPRQLAGAEALVLHARGDGKRYQLRLRTTEDYNGVSYLARFQPEAETWRSFTFQQSDFTATWRGQAVQDAAPLILGDVQSFGLLISDQQAGPFALEVQWIAKL